MNLRHWMTLVEEQDDEDDREMLDDPRVQQLRHLLDLWGQGWSGPAWNTAKLHGDLLALRDVASWWSDTHGTREFYRAFIPTKHQIADLRRTGRCVIETPQDRPLASWSMSDQGALEWIEGFDNWIIIEKQHLNVFIDFVEACYTMHGYRPKFDEVIVIMPPKMTVSREEIIQSTIKGIAP